MTGRLMNSWLELSYQERLILAYAPKPFALISSMTSTWVATCIFRDKDKMNKMYHRLALGMCICSASNAFVVFLVSWLIPYDTHGCIHALGTINTCTIAGFMLQVGLVVQYYYVSLSIYVFMALKYEFQIKKIEWIEKFLHIGVFIVPLATAIYLYSMEMFNPIGMACWINSAPQGCDVQYGPCTRGAENPSFYVFTFGVLQTICCLLTATFIIIACYVNEQKKYKKQISLRPLKGKKEFLERARRTKSMLIAKQGTCYLAIFYSTYIFPTVATVVQIHTSRFVFPTLLLATISFPMDGLFFTLAYLFLLRKNNQPPQIQLKVSTNGVNNFDRNENRISNDSSSATFEISTRNTIDSISHSTEATRQIKRQSWCVSSEYAKPIAENKQNPILRKSFSGNMSRQSFSGVSLFDGTDKEKWALFGVYIGSDSESLDDSESGDDFQVETVAKSLQAVACTDTDEAEF